MSGLTKIDKSMLRLLDKDYLVFVKDRFDGFQYVGEWPMPLERHDELFFNYPEFYVAKREDFQELRHREDLDELEDLDRILVTRLVDGHNVGGVMYKRDLDLSVATWNVLRIWKMPDA